MIITAKHVWLINQIRKQKHNIFILKINLTTSSYKIVLFCILSIINFVKKEGIYSSFVVFYLLLLLFRDETKTRQFKISQTEIFRQQQVPLMKTLHKPMNLKLSIIYCICDIFNIKLNWITSTSVDIQTSIIYI